MIISIAMPDTNNVLPRTLRFHGLSIAQPQRGSLPEAPLSPPEIAQLEPAETPALDAIPPSPPASTPIPDQFKKIQITGGHQLFKQSVMCFCWAEWHRWKHVRVQTQRRGRYTKDNLLVRCFASCWTHRSMTPETHTDPAWGRDITSSDDPDTRLAELKAFLEEWKMAAVRRGREPRKTPGIGESSSKSRPHSLWRSSNSISSLYQPGVEVHVMSNTATAKSKLRKIFTSIELSRVYDRQGKPIGTSAILLAHKSGNTDLKSSRTRTGTRHSINTLDAMSPRPMS